MGKVGKKLHLENAVAREFLAEVIGTFIMVTFTIASIAQNVLSKGEFSSSLTVNFAGGMGVTLGIYFAGGVSGGLLNPAVSFAFVLRGNLSVVKYLFYVVAELMGAFMAAAMLFGVYNDAFNHFDAFILEVNGTRSIETAGVFSTFPRPFVSTFNAFFDQVFGTFLLVGSIFAIADSQNMKPDKGLLPISMGSIVFAIGTSFGFNCGAAINPARDLAPRIFTLIAGWGVQPFSYRDYNWFWVPIAGPFVGAFLAWLVYSLFIELHWPEGYEKKIPIEEQEVNVDTSSKPELNHDGYHNPAYLKGQLDMDFPNGFTTKF